MWLYLLVLIILAEIIRVGKDLKFFDDELKLLKKDSLDVEVLIDCSCLREHFIYEKEEWKHIERPNIRCNICNQRFSPHQIPISINQKQPYQLYKEKNQNRCEHYLDSLHIPLAKFKEDVSQFSVGGDC